MCPWDGRWSGVIFLSLVTRHRLLQDIIKDWPQNTKKLIHHTFYSHCLLSSLTGEHCSICQSVILTSSLLRSWIFKIHKKIVSLTELMAGVKAPSKTCQLFQLMCWPQGYKVRYSEVKIWWDIYDCTRLYEKTKVKCYNMMC